MSGLMAGLRCEAVDLNWHGPFGWGYEDPQSVFTADVSKQLGVYLITSETPTGFLIYAAGVTTRPFHKRFWEHTKEYLAGTYNVLDPEALARDERKVLWEGLWFRRLAHERLNDLFGRANHIAEVAALLRAFRVFLGPLPKDRRLLERIEAAIMDTLYSGPPGIADVPDRGMHLCPRRVSEEPLVIRNHCSAVLRGLPEHLEV